MVNPVFVAIHHDIHDPDVYAERGESIPAEAPEGNELRQFFPSQRAAVSVCLWETRDPDELATFLDDALDGVSTQTYHPVDEAGALGLPEPILQAGADTGAGEEAA